MSGLGTGADPGDFSTVGSKNTRYFRHYRRLPFQTSVAGVQLSRPTNSQVPTARRPSFAHHSHPTPVLPPTPTTSSPLWLPVFPRTPRPAPLPLFRPAPRVRVSLPRVGSQFPFPPTRVPGPTSGPIKPQLPQVSQVPKAPGSRSSRRGRPYPGPLTTPSGGLAGRLLWRKPLFPGSEPRTTPTRRPSPNSSYCSRT